MFYLNLSCLFALANLVTNHPTTDEMSLTQEQSSYLQGETKARNVRLWPRYYWKNSTLVYSFGEGLNTKDKFLITQAMSSITRQTTCVHFRLSTDPQEPQVIIQRRGSGCSSYVGFLNWMDQPLNLGTECMKLGIIQHELLHALSFVHMQSDPHRDEYVKVLYENIREDKMSNFRIFNTINAGDFGYGYDYQSIMHYDSYAFSKNFRPTILPLRRNVKIGQRLGLSPKDILKLRRIYCNN